MILHGQKGEYDVIWETVGYSYARAVIRKRVRFCVLFTRLKRVWDKSTAKPAFEAERMLPQEMLEWFHSAVREYETYENAWSYIIQNDLTKRG